MSDTIDRQKLLVYLRRELTKVQLDILNRAIAPDELLEHADHLLKIIERIKTGDI